MDEAIENKYNANGGINQVLFNSAVAAASECYSCLPAISRGITSSTRIGQRITPKSLRIKGYVSLAADDNTADIMAYMYVFTSKKYKSYNDFVSYFQPTTMLEDGNGGTRAPDGTLWTSLMPGDQASIRILSKKTFHLQKGAGTQNGDTPATAPGVGSSTTIRYFDIKISCPAHLLYDDSPGFTLPTNYAPVVCFGYCHTDGTAPDVQNTALLVNMSSQFYYEDA